VNGRLSHTLTSLRTAIAAGSRPKIAALLADLEDAIAEALRDKETQAPASAAAGAISGVTETEQTPEALHDKIFVDELTGLFNHRYYREQVRLEDARARRYERPLSVVFLDLDFFRRVNGNYGQAVGDRVLQHVADVVQAQLRRADIPVRVDSEPIPARYGGEELVLILPETDLAGATALAERMRAAIEADSFVPPGTDCLIKLTLSAGVASLRETDAEPWDWVQRADQALCRAKARGRNRVEVGT
jgi:diguanylate cyclase (GGDEF)-like protein